MSIVSHHLFWKGKTKTMFRKLPGLLQRCEIVVAFQMFLALTKTDPLRMRVAGGHYPAPRLDSMALRWEKFCYETDLSHYTGTTTMDSSFAKDLKTRQYSAVVYKTSAFM